MREQFHEALLFVVRAPRDERHLTDHDRRDVIARQADRHTQEEFGQSSDLVMVVQHVFRQQHQCFAGPDMDADGPQSGRPRPPLVGEAATWRTTQLVVDALEVDQVDVVGGPAARFADQLDNEILDCIVVTTGRSAYRRPDGIAAVPAALLGP